MRIILIYILLSYTFLCSEDADYYYNLGVQSRDNLIKADSLFNISLAYYQKDDNKEGIAKSLYYIGFCKDIQGDMNNALRYYFNSKHICFDNGFIEYYTKCNSKITFILNSHGLYSQALYYNNQTIQFLNKIENVDSIYYYKAFYEKANVYLYTNRIKSGLSFLSRINSESIKAEHFLNTYYNLLGKLYFSNGDIDLAISYYNKAIEIEPNSKVSLFNKLELCFKTKDPNFEKILAKYNNIKNDATEYIIKQEKLLFAKIAKSKGNFEEAKKYLTELIDYSEDKNLLDLKIIAYQELNDLYNETNNYAGIISNNNLLKELHKEQNVKSVELSNSILNEINKIEKENELLSKENENIRLKYYSAAFIALLFIILSYIFWKYKYTKSYSEGFITDYYVIIDKMRRIVSRQMNDLLNRNMKTLVLNYDLDKDEILFRNLEDLVNVKNKIEKELDKSQAEISSNKEAVKILNISKESEETL